jgi:hypothetical protein
VVGWDWEEVDCRDLEGLIFFKSRGVVRGWWRKGALDNLCEHVSMRIPFI